MDTEAAFGCVLTDSSRSRKRRCRQHGSRHSESRSVARRNDTWSRCPGEPHRWCRNRDPPCVSSLVSVQDALKRRSQNAACVLQMETRLEKHSRHLRCQTRSRRPNRVIGQEPLTWFLRNISWQRPTFSFQIPEAQFDAAAFVPPRLEGNL